MNRCILKQTKRRCSLFTCATNQRKTNDKLILFPLPTNATLLEKWMAAFRENKAKFAPSLAGCFICHLHFDSEQIDTKTGVNGKMLYGLRPGSIPKYFDFKPEIVEMIEMIELSDDELIAEVKKERTEDILVEADETNALLAEPIPPCTKCIQTDIEVQKLRHELVNMKTKLRTKDFQIAQMQKKYTVDPMMQKCTVCMTKVVFEQVLEHLCDKRLQNMKCEHCELAFPATILLLDHLEVFHGDKWDYECLKCNGQKFAMIDLYDIHKNTHWNEVPQCRCEMCNAAYYQQSELDEHIEAEHKAPEEDPFEKPYKCGSCNKSFECPKTLNRHITETHRRQRPIYIDEFEFPFECYQCKAEFKTYLELRGHFRGHRKVKTYTCPVCRSEPNEYDWPTHLCRAQDETIDCEYCSKKCVSISAILEHVAQQHPDNTKVYKCLTCIRCFPIQSMFDLHHELKVDQQKSHACHSCRRQFATAKRLENHIENTHTANRKTRLCDECGKSFSSDWNLKVHQKLHQRRQYKCPNCPATFHFQNALARHSDIHRNMKYVCSICSVELRTLRSLYSHLDRHKRKLDTERKYSCSECDQKFHEKHTFKNHLSRVHSTIRQFQCSYCPCAYKHSGDLNKHLRTHLGDDMYACPESDCSNRYRTPFELQQHSYEHYKRDKVTTASIMEASCSG